MDNLSHSVVGLALGELAERSLAPEPDPQLARVRRRVLLLTGWVASNFPDLDLLATPLAPPPLGYLLHHRGHTHTLLGALPQALVVLGMLWLLWPAARQLLRNNAPARRATVTIAGLCLVLHVGMDYLNVYGVHPFHPFDPRWLYGDMVFIVEPVFWTAFGAPLIAMSGPVARWVLLAMLAGAQAWFAARGYLASPSFAALLLLGFILTVLQRRSGERGRGALAISLALASGFVLVQGAAAHAARAAVARAILPPGPSGRLLDVALSAFPAHPLCWSVATVERVDGDGMYRLRRGVLSLAPEAVPVRACPRQFSGGAHAPQGAFVAWQWEQSTSLQALRGLRRNCHVDAWLRFARVPALIDGSATDIRFGAPDEPNFTTLPYAARAGTPCPRFVPSWGFPRADLLE